MILIELFCSFLKIGFTSFGGLSMIPLINSEMLSHGWMTTAEVADIVAIAEMTPGPLGINCATFAGMRTAGILGAVAANLGVLTPTLSLSVLVAAFFERVKNSRRMKHVMNGVRPACIGMVFGMTMVMCFTNYTNNGKLSLASAAIGLVDLLLLRTFKASVTYLNENKIDIAVLCVPKRVAVSVADVLIENGIDAIWNFTNTDIVKPYSPVLVENVHFSDSLLFLSYQVSNEKDEKVINLQQ